MISVLLLLLHGTGGHWRLGWAEQGVRQLATLSFVRAAPSFFVCVVAGGAQLFWLALITS